MYPSDNCFQLGQYINESECEFCQSKRECLGLNIKSVDEQNTDKDSME